MEKIFCNLTETNKVTGLGLTYLRKGCQDGTIPHIMSGKKYLIDVPKLLEQLREKECR